MRVRIDTASLKESTWHQYAVRFFFGGCITAVAGLVAMKFGPIIGGALLAFPAIFPAGATLIEKHEREKKQKAGLKGDVRGRQAASLDAAGAAIGAIGLLIFALLVWRLLPEHDAWITIPAASAAWLVVSVSVWFARKLIHLDRKAKSIRRAVTRQRTLAVEGGTHHAVEQTAKSNKSASGKD
jgi:TRAP-type uncharacterized transport system fused permease subunit